MSPDDAQIYFSSALGGVNYDIFRIPASGGSPTVWCDIPGRKMTPVFTPDGHHILFAREGGQNIFELWIAPLDAPRMVGVTVRR